MEKILRQITEKPELESRFLNTLSLLEYIGARKISKTFAKIHPPLEVLEHHADETRHAYAFKRLSGFIFKNRFEPSWYLCETEAVSYFHTLDRQFSEWMTQLTQKEDSYQNYLLVTSVVERRAMKFYPLYKKTTSNPEVYGELEKIILEESRHRRMIEDKAFEILKTHGISDWKICDAREEKLFFEFEKSLEKEVLGVDKVIPERTEIKSWK